jgi:hypothetical protein
MAEEYESEMVEESEEMDDAEYGQEDDWYSDIGKVLDKLKAEQDADSDNRDRARESVLFITQRGGQWEQYWWNQNQNKPRYTFDQTSPIVDLIAGRMARSDFAIKVRPGSGDASMADAKLFSGLIRNIEAQSNATFIYNRAGRNMAACGTDGWHIVQQYSDADSFDQDLAIKPIANWLDSVWFDSGAKEQNKSDARCCFVLEAITKAEYKKTYKDGACISVGTDRKGTAYNQKAEQIIIGQVYYVKEEPRVLVETSAGRIFEEGPELDAVTDEMAANGETITRRRSRPRRVVYSRLFDGKDWLTKEQRTVFSYIPVVPTFGNYTIFEDKQLYWGVVEKLMDPQRVFNYSKSREIEEGALAPRAKYWMTPKQAAGHEGTLATLNTNSDPVQFMNPDPEMPGPPPHIGGAQINPGLVNISESMRALLGQTAGMFAANQGDNPGLQSGVAIEKLLDRGDIGSSDKYITSQEVAIAQTAKILIDAIPRVYDTKRMVQILGEDGTAETVPVNAEIFDKQTGRIVKMNDLSRGKYSVTCSAGPSFRSRQAETVAAITEAAAIDPSVIETASDILFSNIPAPGMDLVAKRKRQQLFLAGVIPDEQLTAEEMAQKQAAAQQPPQKTADMVLAEAEAKKAEAQTQKVLVDAQAQQQTIQLRAVKDQRDAEAQAAEIMLKQQAQQLAEMQAAAKAQSEQFAQSLKMQQAMVEALNTQAATLKLLREAMGADAVVSPAGAVIYQQQQAEVAKTQDATGL